MLTKNDVLVGIIRNRALRMERYTLKFIWALLGNLQAWRRSKEHHTRRDNIHLVPDVAGRHQNDWCLVVAGWTSDVINWSRSRVKRLLYINQLTIQCISLVLASVHVAPHSSWTHKVRTVSSDLAISRFASQHNQTAADYNCRSHLAEFAHPP